MAQPLQPFGQNTVRQLGVNSPGVVTYAGSFTTDSNGNVTSVSGIAPGMTVSGTSLSSGVYTCFFGDGPNINQVGNGANSFPGGAPAIGNSFARVLWLSGEVVQEQLAPTSDCIQATQRDGLAGQGRLQFLTSTVATPQLTPAVMRSKTVQVLAIIQAHKDVT